MRHIECIIRYSAVVLGDNYTDAFLFEKITVSLCDQHAAGVSVYLCVPHINIWMPEPDFIKLDMYNISKYN
jgi:hypothetical protein